MGEKKALSDAVQHTKRENMSKFKTSRVFGIPRTTLSRRLLTMNLESPASKPTILCKDEEHYRRPYFGDGRVGVWFDNNRSV